MTSQNPMRRPIVVGATARKLAPQTTTQPGSAPARTLAPVTRPVVRRASRRRPKAFFAFIAAGVMFGVMIAQMLLSIATESGAYEIAHLQSEYKEATRTYQATSQDLDRVSSPQHLARNAEALGMLSNNTPAYMRLSDGAVLGAPTSGDGFVNLVAGDGGALVPNSLLTDVPIVTTSPAEAAAAAAAAAGNSATPANSQTGATTGAPEPPAPTGPVPLSNGLPGLSTH